MNLLWHPESTAFDQEMSPMKNYLAVATNDSAINIFEISDDIIVNNTLEKFYKTIAVLNAHTSKVVCLAWNPHISGYLVSGSYDKTAQVTLGSKHKKKSIYISK